MKKIILLFSVSVFAACASDEKKAAVTTDSAPKVDTVVCASKVKTDSGTLLVNLHNGEKTGEATMLSPTGKLRYKGIYLNDQKNGAWLTYDENGKCIYAAHYGDGVIQHVLDPADFNFDTLHSAELGFSILVPSGWNKSKTIDSAAVSLSKTVKDPAVRYKPQIKITKVALEMGDDLHSLTAEMNKTFPYTVDHFLQIAADSMLVNSCPAYLEYGMYNTADNGIGFLKAIVVSGKSAYYFDCTAQNYENAEFLLYQGVFEMIVRSFKPEHS